MLRRLRYLPALALALLALAFVGLWARSYYSHDFASVTIAGRRCELRSLQGELYVTAYRQESWPHYNFRWHSRALIGPYLGRPFGFGMFINPAARTWTLPHWFPVAASFLALAALFAFKRTWRYSLRTILVATTLLAAVLGLAVYAV